MSKTYTEEELYWAEQYADEAFVYVWMICAYSWIDYTAPIETPEHVYDFTSEVDIIEEYI